MNALPFLTLLSLAAAFAFTAKAFVVDNHSLARFAGGVGLAFLLAVISVVLVNLSGEPLDAAADLVRNAAILGSIYTIFSIKGWEEARISNS